MTWCTRFCCSSVGLKFIMGVTGLMLVAFVAFHLQGNLNFYAGPEAMNRYAEMMQSLGALKWLARAGLLAVFITHIFVALKLAAENKSARPHTYAIKKPIESSLASRTMVLSGLVVLIFVLYHLAHFTFLWVGDIGGYTDAAGRHDVYKMMVLGFQNPLSSVLYLVGNIALGLHMSHGIQSAFQSLGLRDRKYSPHIETGGVALAWLLAAGNISMPLAVLFGFVTL